MIKVIVRFSFMMPVLLVLFSGCSTSTSVIARRNPACWPTLASRISIPKRDLRTPELDELGRALNAEFVRRGVTLAPSGKSEYALSFWIEENWEGRSDADRPRRLWSGPVGGNYVATPGYPGASVAIVPSEGMRMYPNAYDATIHDAPNAGLNYSKGIRLRLFVTQPQGTNRLETAWEGYVDGGPRMSSDEYGALLRVLLDYFGHDHVGKVKLVE